MGSLLQAEGVSKVIGSRTLFKGIAISLEDGERVGMIGPNGAGKSTLFNLISGHLRPERGRITFRGDRVEGLSPHQRATRGIAIVFQGARIFRGMTVRENVMVGAHSWTRHGFIDAVLRTPRHFREEREIRRSADSALERVGLSDWADRDADVLPLGQQRAMQVARALCARPTLLLLDEPASGLRAGEREHLARLLEGLRGSGLTMMLVEHDIQFVARLADRITVLYLGQVLCEGTPDEVRRDPRVIDAYLGREASP
jgi:branched-chain amino acid transport system ATP-binding protein